MTFYTLSAFNWVQCRAEPDAFVCAPLSLASSVPVLLIIVVVPPVPVVVMSPRPVIASGVWIRLYHARLGNDHRRLRHDHGGWLNNHRPGVNRNRRCGSDDNWRRRDDSKRERHPQPNGDMDSSRVCRTRQGNTGKTQASHNAKGL